MAAFNSTAVGMGSVRKKYEDRLRSFLKKAFEVILVIYSAKTIIQYFLFPLVFSNEASNFSSSNTSLRLCHFSFRSHLQDIKKDAFREAYLQCTSTIENMGRELRKACHAPGASVDTVVKVHTYNWKFIDFYLYNVLEGT